MQSETLVFPATFQILTTEVCKKYNCVEFQSHRACVQAVCLLAVETWVDLLNLYALVSSSVK